MDSSPILDVSDVTLRFGGVTALEEASFSVKSGELFAIIGPNGAGKTSIFNCINGVYKPQNGSILLEGDELSFTSGGDENDCWINYIKQDWT